MVKEINIDPFYNYLNQKYIFVSEERIKNVIKKFIKEEVYKKQ